MDYTCLVFMIVLLIIVHNTSTHCYGGRHCVPGRCLSHPECVSPVIARKFRGY